MATPGEMVNAVAEALKMQPVSVGLIDRRLQETGHRTKAGRGGAAAQMTPRDVANLLIASKGFSVVKEIDQDLVEYSGFEVISGSNGDARVGDLGVLQPWHVDGLELPALYGLHEKHTFGEAVEALLKDASSGALAEHSCRVRVVMQDPFKQAVIVIDSETYQSRRLYLDISNPARANFRSMMRDADEGRDHKFGKSTLLHLGKLIAHS